MTLLALRPALVTVEADGILPTDTVAQFQTLLAPVLGKWTDYSHIRVTRLPHADVIRPVVAQLELRHPQGCLRTQVATTTVHDAVLALIRRSVTQLRLLPDSSRGGTGHRPVRTPLPSWSPELRPPGRREITRSQISELTPTTVAEAIRTLEWMDHEFHLFHDAGTEQDAIVCRSGAGSFRLTWLEPRGPSPRVGRALTVDRQPVTWRTVREVTRRLDLTGRPYEFFADKMTGRGRVLYARYDGNYGLLGAAGHLITRLAHPANMLRQPAG